MLALVLSLLAFGVGAASAQIPPAPADPRAMVEQMVTAYMQRTGTHAVAVSLYFKGKDYLLSFGDGGGFRAPPVTPDLLFGIGSVTKVFTVNI